MKEIVYTDSAMGFYLKLCNDCAKELEFKPNINGLIECETCKKLFKPQDSKIKTCKVCWAKTKGLYHTINERAKSGRRSDTNKLNPQRTLK